jgi:predicted dehydrogenase
MRDRFQVIGVYNSVQALAENSARELDATSFGSFREMMESPSLDAIFVLEEDWYRLVPVYAACDFGKAIFCGSEIDLTSTAANEIKQRTQSSGVAFMNEFSRRFAPATLRLKELIATRLGRPRLLFCHRRLACENRDLRHGRSLESRSQRELLELIDWCNYIVGSTPNWVQAIRHLRFGTRRSTTDRRPQSKSAAKEAWHSSICLRPSFGLMGQAGIKKHSTPNYRLDSRC